jgi:hypothetical protein
MGGAFFLETSMTMQTPVPANEGATSFVYGPHRELLNLVERLEEALAKPHRRASAIDAAIVYLLKLYQMLDDIACDMNERKAREARSAAE